MPPEGFFVEDTEGPLQAGELERAASWALKLLNPGKSDPARLDDTGINSRRIPPMTNKAKRSAGLTLVILGMLIFILSTVNYYLDWNQVRLARPAIGLILIVLGVFLLRDIKGVPPEP